MMRFPSSATQRHRWILPALASLFCLIPSSGAPDPDLLQRLARVLELRKELLSGYSVEVENRTIANTPFGNQRFDSRERHYLGGNEEFKKEILSLTRNGQPMDPSSRRGRGGRFRNVLGPLEGLDILTSRDFLRKAEIVGPATVDERPAVEVKTEPKIRGLKVRDARIWIDPETAMPFRVRMHFSAGVFISDAKLTLDLVPDPNQGITVPRFQTATVTMGGFGRGGGFGGGGRRGGGGRGGSGGGRMGFGGGFEIETSQSWKAYQWGLEFEKDFFKAASTPAPSRQRRTRRQASFDDDPFEEIRIGDQQSFGAQERSLEETTEEVLIQGASLRQGGGFGASESQIMGAVMGRGGRGGRGGFRGARIAGGRVNRIQGSVSTGFSGSVLDAKPYSLDGGETPDPDYISWNTGISAGGPLIRGDSSSRRSFFGRRRSFFFVDFNTSWGDELRTQYASVPTAAERRGDFSQTTYRSGPLAGEPVRIFDPAGGQAYSGASLRSGQLNPVSQSLLAYVPLPNRKDPYLNFLNLEPLRAAGNRLNSRIFHSLSDSLRLTGGYNFNRNDRDEFNAFPSLYGRGSERGQNLSVNLVQTTAGGLLHNVRVRWNRNRSRRLNPFAFQTNVSSDLGIRNTSMAAIDFGLPQIQFTNYTSLSDGSSSLNIRETHSVSDSLQLTFAGHHFRIGGEVAWNRWNQLGSPEGAGVQVFAGVATSAYHSGRPVAGTGYDFADFLLGLAQSSRIQYGNSDHYLRAPEYSLFINDNWRIHSRLTLQWGLRYEYVAPWSELYDRMANLDVDPGFQAAATVLPGSRGPYTGSVPRALIRDDRNNLAPRVAMALRLRSGQLASVLRANYGIFHPHESYAALAGELISQPPFGFAIQETVAGQDFLPIESAFSKDLEQEVPNTYAVDPNFRLATVQTWNLSLQQGLPYNFFLSLGYAGSRGTGLELLRAPNRLLDGIQRIRDTAQFLFLTPGASSYFHGLQVLAVRRVRSGFTLNLRYEYGKSLDNAATLSGGGRVVAQNDDDLNSEWGPSNLDRRHTLRLGGFYELPFGDRHRWLRNRGILSSIFSNWFLNTNLTVNSGRFLTARVLGNQINNSGSASQASERASVTGVPVMLPASQRTTGGWFNTAAFRLPDPGSFGNAGRNTIQGPGSWTIDLGLARSIPVGGEGMRLILQADATNLLNHVNYTGLNTIVNSRGFGRITSVSDMRRIQLRLRFMF